MYTIFNYTLSMFVLQQGTTIMSTSCTLYETSEYSCLQIEGLHDAVRSHACMIFPRSWAPLLGFLFLQRVMEKNQKQIKCCLLFWIHHIIELQISHKRVCVCSYSCHSVVIWYYDIIEILSSWTFCCVSHIKLWEVETNLAVTSAMTCQIGYI